MKYVIRNRIHVSLIQCPIQNPNTQRIPQHQTTLSSVLSSDKIVNVNDLFIETNLSNPNDDGMIAPVKNI